MRVAELMTPALVHASVNTPLSTAALRMDRLGIRHLPVLGLDGRLVGVVTDAMVHRHGMVLGNEFIAYEAHPPMTGDLALPADVVARPDDDLLPLLRKLARTRQDSVIVVDEREHPVGIVTEHDLLKVAMVVVPEGLTVEHLPMRAVVSLAFAEPASLALELMVRHRIRHIPVTLPGDGLLGVVSYRDLVAEDVIRRKVTLDEVRSAQAFTATPTETLLECAGRMLERHVGCLPVVQGGRLVGMVTRRDLIAAAATGLEDEALFESAESSGWDAA